jgi:GntR family transcriptional regulator/MocR family aminotransferase
MLLLRPGDQTYVEDPGYLESRLAWRRAGASVVPGSIDDQGLCLPSPRRGRISLIYTTPSRQFPTGIVLSLTRRLALLEFAASSNAWVVEDDYDSELRYRAAPLPSLQSLDHSGLVIYVGTFSKLLFPSLRLGYVVLPDQLLDRFIELKHLTDDHLPLIDQATLASFLETGAFYSHIRRCRRAYAERQAVFLSLFGGGDLPLRFPYTDGGMNLTGFLPPSTNDRAWSQRLSEGGFDVPPVSHYADKPTSPGLVFGFTAFSPEVILKSFKRVESILRSLAAQEIQA